MGNTAAFGAELTLAPTEGGKTTKKLAAIQIGCRLGPDATVVALLADSGLKSRNTDVYRSGA